MRVLVIGASGGTGRQLVEQALERGDNVTAFVRDPRRLPVRHESLHIAVGDVLDPQSLQRAVRDQDAVVCALGHKRWFYPNKILSAGTQNIIDAMKEKGIRRLVCETSLGVGNSFGRLGIYYTLFVVPFILPLYYWDKLRQERAIRASGLDWIIVRAGFGQFGVIVRARLRLVPVLPSTRFYDSKYGDLSVFLADPPAAGPGPPLRHGPGLCGVCGGGQCGRLDLHAGGDEELRAGPRAGRRGPPVRPPFPAGPADGPGHALLRLSEPSRPRDRAPQAAGSLVLPAPVDRPAGAHAPCGELHRRLSGGSRSRGRGAGTDPDLSLDLEWMHLSVGAPLVGALPEGGHKGRPYMKRYPSLGL
jgi:hypothetical protein